MSRRTIFEAYRPATILNKGKRADHWFWSRYSVYPYLGCQHGCLFCYCRERKFSPYDDPQDFAYHIKVKENAPELVRRGLSRAPLDVVFTGDYQPAERKFLLSRQILRVCCEMGFPVLVLERSPLVLRDLDILQDIQSRARAVVAFSIISTPDSPGYTRVRQMENLAPPPEKRFAAMEKLAAAGILTGTCMMPVLPGICDDDANLEQVVRWTAEHSGQFVLCSSLTLADQQRDFFLNTLGQRFPDLLDHYRRLYPPGSYAPADDPSRKLAQRVRELCNRYGIFDRMPRPIIPGEKRELNKRIVEILANQAYTLELEGASEQRIWAFRKAAWAVEDLPQEIGLLFRTLGVKGIQSIPNITGETAQVIENQLSIRSAIPIQTGKNGPC
jgi:DNA repair photolyase